MRYDLCQPLEKVVDDQLPGRYLRTLVDELRRTNGMTVDEIAEYNYGKFVHVLDPKGNLIERQEPNGKPNQA